MVDRAPSPPSDDADATAALAAARQGDTSLVGGLLEFFRPRLLRTLASHMHPALHGRLDVEDVLQDAYTEVLQRLTTLANQPASTRPPLFLWVRFLVLQRLQQVHRFHLGTDARDARRERLRLDATHGPLSSLVLAGALARSGVTPSALVAREEQAGLVTHALDALAEDERQILLLRHFEGLSNVEAAQVLGVSEATASRRRVAALEQLRRVLKELGVEVGSGPGWIPRP